MARNNISADVRDLFAGLLSNERAKLIEHDAESDQELAARIWLMGKFALYSSETREKAIRCEALLAKKRGTYTGDLWQVRNRLYVSIKSALEFLLAILLIVFSAPVLLLAALLVKLTSSGPAFYSLTRIGKNGRPFSIYKLRTMYDNCDSAYGPRWSMPGDARITPLGRILRRTHLDELPQLWNVVRCDMALVGPRPERPEFIPNLAQALPHYADRLLVRPGMTGLAQVQLPPDTDLESVRRKLAYDLYYVRYVSWWLDLRIILSTMLYLLGLPEGLFCQLRIIPGQKPIEEAYRAITHTADLPPDVEFA